ncbi:MAG: nitroreductase family protein, partial [Candidatus Anstonellaceae archaeon]
MEFDEIVMKRYATKKFDGRKVDEALVERLLEIIRFAPSSYNMQPWKVKVIADQETKEKLFQHTQKQAQITTCSHLLVFCAYIDIEERLQKRLEQMKEQGLDA